MSIPKENPNTDGRNNANACLNMKKCIRHGSNICYTDLEQIKNFKKFSLDEPSNDTETDDALYSGESLFKTLSFDQRDSQHEVEKCIEFWKCVAKKNLEPVKCSIINHQTDYEVPQSSCECIESVEKVNRRRRVPGKRPLKGDKKLPETAANKWLEIMKELQRKKLDKIKLMIQKQNEGPDRNEDCDIEQRYDKEQIKQELVALNSWRPKSSQKHQREKAAANESVKDTPANRFSTANLTPPAKNREYCTFCGKDLCVCLKCDQQTCSDIGFYEQMIELTVQSSQNPKDADDSEKATSKKVTFDLKPAHESLEEIVLDDRKQIWDSMIASEIYEPVLENSAKMCQCGYNDCDCNINAPHCDCGNDFCRCKIGGYNLFSELAICCESPVIYDDRKAVAVNSKVVEASNGMFQDVSIQCSLEYFKEKAPINTLKYCIICDHFGCGCETPHKL